MTARVVPCWDRAGLLVLFDSTMPRPAMAATRVAAGEVVVGVAADAVVAEAVLTGVVAAAAVAVSAAPVVVAAVGLADRVLTRMRDRARTRSPLMIKFVKEP